MVQYGFCILQLARLGSGERRRTRKAQDMRLVLVLWLEMSVRITSPKYMGRKNIGAGTVTLM